MDVLLLAVTLNTVTFDSEEVQIQQYLACLEHEGLDVYLYQMEHDGNNVFGELDAFLKYLKLNQPRLIYMAITNENTEQQFTLLEIMKGILHNTTFCVGGAIVNHDSEYYLKNGADIAIIGEGDATIVELSKCILHKHALNDCRGILYKRNDEVIKTEPRPLIQDLDSLPFPKRVMLEKNQYPYVKIIGTRGCSKNCSFCLRWKFDANESNILVRERSIDSVLSEIDMINDQYGVNTFMIYDDSFEDSKLGIEQKIYQFFDGAKDLGKNLFFKINFRSESIAKMGLDVLQYMKNNGLINIFVGLESGDDQTLKLFNKNTTVAQNLRAVDILEKAHIPLRNGFIMFHPYSSTDEFKKNIDFIHQIKHGYRINNYLKRFLLYKGCDLYDKIKCDGLIADDYSVKNLFGYSIQDPAIEKIERILHTHLEQKKNLTNLAGMFTLKCDEMDDKLTKLEIMTNEDYAEFHGVYMEAKRKINEDYYSYFLYLYDMAEKRCFKNIKYTLFNKLHLIDGIKSLETLINEINTKLRKCGISV